ncbi:hypothetical protein NDU88_000591 [Pleurodeles waltl]|uniref:Uncharacterized protein n=1 Tax=Pleurodeles waltl TaxID=8319 RepID=A0AAV7S6J6_PLEWA|nr:hypothetical protein NDU88_000591 [Pleurodeles waltl]
MRRCKQRKSNEHFRSGPLQQGSPMLSPPLLVLTRCLGLVPLAPWPAHLGTCSASAQLCALLCLLPLTPCSSLLHVPSLNPGPVQLRAAQLRGKALVSDVTIATKVEDAVKRCKLEPASGQVMPFSNYCGP